MTQNRVGDLISFPFLWVSILSGEFSSRYHNSRGIQPKTDKFREWLAKMIKESETEIYEKKIKR